MNTPSAIGANLARLRHAKRVSQKALAERAGLSRLAIGKIERGQTLPRAATLRALAKALRASSFDLATPVRELRSVRFRARKRIRERPQILAEVGSWLDDFCFLEQELDDTAPFKLQRLLKNRQTASPEELARSVRAALKLGDAPIHDICGLLESCGIKVLRIRRATDSFFGLSVAAEEGGPAVVVNVWERIPVERWIFSAAHELGHLLLHPAAYDAAREDEAGDEEREADAFAGELLMPREKFEREWAETAGHSFYERVLKVKRIFHVSYKTVLRRLVENGADAKQVYPRFQAQHKRRFKTTLKKSDEPETLAENTFDARYAQAEPAHLAHVDFLEDRLALLVRRAIEADKINIGRGAEILHLSLGEMRVRVREWHT